MQSPLLQNCKLKEEQKFCLENHHEKRDVKTRTIAYTASSSLKKSKCINSYIIESLEWHLHTFPPIFLLYSQIGLIIKIAYMKYVPTTSSFEHVLFCFPILLVGIPFTGFLFCDHTGLQKYRSIKKCWSKVQFYSKH